MTKPKTKPLASLTVDELRAEAAGRGLLLGSTLGQEQLVALLEGEEQEPDREEEAPRDPEERAAARFASPSQRFSTVSLARILAAQGLSREAAAVCRKVLARSPGERRARRLLAEVAPDDLLRLDSSSPPPPREADEAGAAGPWVRPALPADYGQPLCVLLPQQPDQLFVLWEVDQELDQRGAGLAGPTAERVVRLHSVWRTSQGVASGFRDWSVGDRRGERFVGGCRPAAIHRAALGWLAAEGRFVSLCHSGAAWTPPGEPGRGSHPSLSRPALVPPAEADPRAALAIARRLR